MKKFIVAWQNIIGNRKHILKKREISKQRILKQLQKLFFMFCYIENLVFSRADHAR